jgi:hypothetical protein
MKRFGITAMTAAALFATTAAPVLAAKRPRPTDVQPKPLVSALAPNAIQVFNDYATPARFHAGQRAVVHYVVSGVDAPPLNDDDADGVPDYVERVADAADTAIPYYERRGFARIAPDTGGPDTRPDIYVSRFAPGYFGLALPAADAQGGAFLAISNALDPSPTDSLGSLYGTVAHELFHLVQFSYFPAATGPDLGSWALEGMAAAMETRVYPELDDIVSSLQLRRWYDAPDRSLTGQSYGSQLLWRYLDERSPRLLPAFLAGARADSRASALAADYRRIAHLPFAQAFERFAVWVEQEHGDRLARLKRLGPGRETGGSVAPLAIHYVELSPSTRSVSLRFTGGRGGRATLTYRVESESPGFPAAFRTLQPVRGGGELRYAIPATLRANARFESATLVVANGDPSRPAAYRLVTG